MLKYLWVTQLGSTLAMTGLIWLIQIVQYPLFSFVGAQAFDRYHHGHTQLIAYVVIPLMLLELTSTVLVVFFLPPGQLRTLSIIGLGLLVLIWASTAFIQVPQHGLLAQGFSEDVYTSLVRGNWIRTFAWTLRAIILLSLTALHLSLPEDIRR